MAQFDLVLEDFWSQQSFVETESGGYLFNLPSTAIVLKLETAEQKANLSHKLSKYLFRETALGMIGFIFGSIFSLPIDSIILIILIMNWHCRFKFWPGLYSHFAEELASSPRGSFTQFRLLKAQGNYGKLKSNYITACFFAIMYFSIFICLVSSVAPVFVLNVYAGLNWVMNICLLYSTYLSGLTAWRLRSVLTEENLLNE